MLSPELRYLYGLYREGIKLDLSATRQFSQLLGNPQNDFGTFHIAGTNGKGSTSAYIYNILMEEGSTGLYTSPHLVSFNERIVAGRDFITDDELIEFVRENKPLIEKLALENRNPTFFEATTVLAFKHFSKRKVKYASIEVGLGGRLDSTNIVDPEASVITQVGYEHADKLGCSLTSIAGEKAGVVKPGKPVILGDTKKEVIDDIERSVKHMVDDGKIPIMLGGEHSLTTGLVRNFKGATMIIIDAHSDFRYEYMGSIHNHACVTRRSLEILGPGKIFSVGTRSVSKEEFEDPDFSKVRFFSANEVRRTGIQAVIDEIEKHAGDRIYFSIDMDGIDPSEAPGVGTPEPYGIASTEVRALINHFAKRIVGFDVLEFSPVYDNGNTSMLAAKFIQDFIGSREAKS